MWTPNAYTMCGQALGGRYRNRHYLNSQPKTEECYICRKIQRALVVFCGGDIKNLHCAAPPILTCCDLLPAPGNLEKERKPNDMEKHMGANLLSLPHRQNPTQNMSSITWTWNFHMWKLLVICVLCVPGSCTCVRCATECMLSEFARPGALEQQSHKQTAVLSRESAIRRCRTASVLQQAINTESIIAPRGATGQGDREKTSS